MFVKDNGKKDDILLWNKYLWSVRKKTLIYKIRYIYPRNVWQDPPNTNIKRTNIEITDPPYKNWWEVRFTVRQGVLLCRNPYGMMWMSRHQYIPRDGEKGTGMCRQCEVINVRQKLWITKVITGLRIYGDVWLN